MILSILIEYRDQLLNSDVLCRCNLISVLIEIPTSTHSEFSNRFNEHLEIISEAYRHKKTAVSLLRAR